MWRPLLDELGPDVTAIIPDLPGFGRSADHTYPTHGEVVDELVAVLDEHAPDGAIIVGFSLGAQLALLLASARPALVRGTVVVSGETEPAPFQKSTLALLGITAPLARQEWFARLQGRELAVPAALMDDYVRDSAATSRATLLASVGENIRFSIPPELADVDGPVHVMVGGRERKLMHRSAQTTVDTVRGATLEVVPDAGHDIPFTHPAELARAIRDVLGRAGS